MPPGYESLSGVVVSQFSFCTGAQWKTWTMVASPYVLADVLPKEDYVIWMKFVNACRAVVKPTVSLEEAQEGQNLFVQFGESVACHYSSRNVTPNMHFHSHTLDMVILFASIYNIWIFNFERLNYLMKKVKTNNKGCFEITIAKTFNKRKNANNFILELADGRNDITYLTADHANFLLTISGYSKESISKTVYPTQPEFNAFYQLSACNNGIRVTGSEPIPLYSTPKGETGTFNKEHFKLLTLYYQQYAYENKTIRISSKCTIFTHIFMAGQRFNSAQTTSKGGPFISAFFGESVGDDDASFPGKVEYFFENKANVDGVVKVHKFAFVSWYKNHGSSGQRFKEGGLEFWREEHEPLDKYAILPLQRIYNHISVVHFESSNSSTIRKKLLVIPLEKKMYL
jgi:hypothetical protein